MEVKFIENTLQCMRPLNGQVHKTEQTLEIRLPDACPDIGKVLGCWGQVLVRGKEWRAGAIGANGGVMAWVLYAPEDGTTPRVIDGWLPFQCRWDIPDERDDGVIHLCPMLTQLDARSLSARKMMVRAAVDTYAAPMVRQTVTLADPPQIPEDVQLLITTYPAELPMEAGEKQLQIDESFVLPENMPPVHKIIHYNLKPTITEQKVLGDRLVFRGQTDVEMGYITEDGSIHHWRGDFPFSQYTQLDREYSPGASAWVSPVLTALELTLADGQLNLQGGMAAQYTIFDRTTVEIVEDAFSPIRDVQLNAVALEMPMLLDRLAMELPFESSVASEEKKVIVTDIYPEYPVLQLADVLQVELGGHISTLSQDSAGQLSGESIRFSGTIPFESSPENQHFLWVKAGKQTDIFPSGDGFGIKGCIPISAHVYSGAPMYMGTQLEIGEIKPQDADRPSIVLRRAGDDNLWTIAKHCGSTVAAIREANKLSGEPEAGQMLLIPIG